MIGCKWKLWSVLKEFEKKIEKMSRFCQSFVDRENATTCCVLSDLMCIIRFDVSSDLLCIIRFVMYYQICGVLSDCLCIIRFAVYYQIWCVLSDLVCIIRFAVYYQVCCVLSDKTSENLVEHPYS